MPAWLRPGRRCSPLSGRRARRMKCSAPQPHCSREAPRVRLSGSGTAGGQLHGPCVSRSHLIDASRDPYELPQACPVSGSRGARRASRGITLWPLGPLYRLGISKVHVSGSRRARRASRGIMLWPLGPLCRLGISKVVVGKVGRIGATGVAGVREPTAHAPLPPCARPRVRPCVGPHGFGGACIPPTLSSASCAVGPSTVSVSRRFSRQDGRSNKTTRGMRGSTRNMRVRI